MGLGDLFDETDTDEDAEMLADRLADETGVGGELLDGELSFGRPIEECVDEKRDAVVLCEI